MVGLSPSGCGGFTGYFRQPWLSPTTRQSASKKQKLLSLTCIPVSKFHIALFHEVNRQGQPYLILPGKNRPLLKSVIFLNSQDFDVPFLSFESTC